MQKIFDFNYDWQFFPKWNDEMRLDNLSCHGENVTIPHTPRIESLDVTKPYTGVMYYKKLFKIPSELASKNLFIDFEGVMTKAVVYLNGKKLATHYGGYLPFSVDITSYIKMGTNNLLVVEVDNRDNSNIPPGKPTSDVDFLYFGGIYRNVKLRATDKVYVDKNYASKESGVFVYTDKVDEAGAHIVADVVVNNSYFKGLRVSLKCSLINADGVKVSEVDSMHIVIKENSSAMFTNKLLLADPILWDVDNPYLYTLRAEVYANDELNDVVDTTIGIRTVNVTQEGFFLNGKLVRLNGVNRHQQFPYIGIAGSDNADRRDMAKLKEAGFNIVRLSHYPQSDALMDECDRLGLMVMVATPGWQFCKSGVFKKRVIENIRDMVRRDRNHASAVIWEASLNETGFWWHGASDGWFSKCVRAVREEFKPYNALVCGDTIGRRKWKKIGYDIPFTGWDNKKKIRTLDGDIKGITREYGDYEFGGHNSTTRVRLSDGEMAMRIQTHNFMWSHNMNNGSKYELGDLIWEGIDHNRGMGQDKPTSTSGILNEWRLPKFSYYFFKSQSDREDMVYIPTFWNAPTNGKILVFSNADEVELVINGQKIARKTKSPGKTELFDPKLFDGDATVDYWKKGGVYDTKNKAFDLAKYVLSTLDDGGNSENLAHPPFVFDNIDYKDGYIEAKAYKNGKLVATHKVCTPGKFEDIVLDVDYAGKKLANDGRDVVFVRAYVVDSQKTPVLDEKGEVNFSAINGSILGSETAEIETGIASAILRADKGASSVSFTATYKDITRTMTVDIEKVEVEEL